ncbi:hypothetical protein Nepgr_031118 [Nepenthes gracilis]|uniref:ARM repeat superfamily protein n=1 Tax=Nepenthes gracilis TaxID=150966 RepID=A0AAD3TGQ6_NEPGR|nr:hypothetical protein Nepgr_031118 [Nepenthes gracilis]
MKGKNRGNSADLLMTNRGSSAEIDGAVKLQIQDLQRMSDSYTASATIFEPQTTIEKRESSTGNSSPPGSGVRAPEKKLTLFSLRLAVLEKSATGLGALSFIWATVVLLGGFAIVIEKTDFWFITIILLVEGTRLFSRSHELQWQHQSTWSLTDAGRNSYRLLQSSSRFLTRAFKAIFRPVSAIGSKSQHKGQTEEVAPRSRPEDSDKRRKISRRWESSDVPLLPYASWVFLSKNISKLLHWLQVVAAIACVVLSLIKLIKHNYGEVDKSEKKNRKSALIIFYSLALAEALLFLLEKAYWELKIIYGKLLEEVTKECGLEASAVVSVRRFFYDAYSRCLDGSIFDGLKMDMVSFSMDLLESDSHDEQLIGARILRTFATSERFSHDTLQKIGVTFSIMERLVEMLNWKGPQEEEIREAAGVIVAKLAGKKQNSLRVAGIPGAIESISSLLYTTRNSTAAFDEIGDRNLIFDHPHYGFWTFNHLGLKILKKLASDPGNCGKIGNTRGLLPKIIDFSHAEERLLKDKNAAASQIMTVKISLLVIKKLVSTAGTTGKQLRQEIGEIVFTISNIRDILRFGEKHPELQKLSVEILTSLAIDDDATERIGCTGGIIKELLNIFFKEGMPEEQNHVRIAAGEALTMLAMESNSNCKRILRLGAVKKLVSSLEVPFLCENAARILRNLCTYCGEECFIELRGVTAAVPTVLKGIMSADNKLQEVMVGLAAHAFKFLTPDESRIMFEKVGIQTTEIAKALVHILKKYPKPPIKIPRVRRYTIELTIWMMKENRTNASIFKNLGLQQELQNVLETTSELESFHIFSGAVGLNRFRTSIHSMVETALILMDDKLEDLGASH